MFYDYDDAKVLWFAQTSNKTVSAESGENGLNDKWSHSILPEFEWFWVDIGS